MKRPRPTSVITLCIGANLQAKHPTVQKELRGSLLRCGRPLMWDRGVRSYENL